MSVGLPGLEDTFVLWRVSERGWEGGREGGRGVCYGMRLGGWRWLGSFPGFGMFRVLDMLGFLLRVSLMIGHFIAYMTQSNICLGPLCT